MAVTYNLKTGEDYVCNVLPVNIDYIGSVAEGSTNWAVQLEETQETEELRKGWSGDVQVEDVKPEEVKIEEPDNGPIVSVNYLRGRRLLGKKHSLEGYSLVVFEQRDDGMGGVSDTQVYDQVAQSTEMVSFGHDKVPDVGEDDVLRIQEWIKLNEQIHQ